ncbi:peptidoglycan-binding protein [Clostridium estertheticum]|uniref:GH25 family lysozyme n=1 Tax=Clostridium estertheticum TaxID=238834 RepID=UPI001C0E40A9|nr:GH25 family lysozyme [Clostridium estertheticum]MBU3200990.1 peptidoglycan-binding protein [Clostridium estertheticum]WAG68041.1 peptidoglycan-binding protein [Clostridium estertheticum]
MDISSYEANVDFEKVKNSGIEIVYIKATEGLTYTNPLLKSQYDGAKAAGLKIGFYHYLRANDPILEAKFFLSVIEGLSSDCKHAIDVEEVSLGQTIAKTSSNIMQFANYIISTNNEVCLYTGDYFYANNLNSSVKDIPLWVAHYGVTKPDAVNYIGFQYSESGRIDGINGSVDLNEFSTSIFVSSTPPVIITNIVVKAFQHAVNLVGLKDKNGDKLIEDGIKGTHTNDVIAKISFTNGSHNELIRWIQQRLIALGFSCGETGADSYFGVNTLVAVKKFQTIRALKSDGIVGPLTINQLLK